MKAVTVRLTSFDLERIEYIKQTREFINPESKNTTTDIIKYALSRMYDEELKFNNLVGNHLKGHDLYK